MLRKIRQRIQSEESGFTLIELLVVVLIIGILAAIAIPAFLGQREKAQDGEAKSAVRNAASAAEAFYTDAQSYNGLSPAALKSIEPSLNDTPGAFTAVPSNGDQTVTLGVVSKTGNTYTIVRNGNVAVDADDGKTTRTCTTTGKAGCPTSGNW